MLQLSESKYDSAKAIIIDSIRQVADSAREAGSPADVREMAKMIEETARDLRHIAECRQSGSVRARFAYDHADIADGYRITHITRR